MKWGLIIKTHDSSIEGLRYGNERVRNHIRNECNKRCIYCSISEGSLGGQRLFTIEHYRPKSRFKDLTDDQDNLFYACAICNSFKQDDWPNEPLLDYSVDSYPSPAQVDYATLFDVNYLRGEIVGKYVASVYITERLYLNRPHLMLERVRYRLNERYTSLMDENVAINERLENSSDPSAAIKYVGKMAELNLKLSALMQKLEELAPYETQDVSR